MGWVIRLLNFIRYLAEYGWRSIVLTVKEEYYKENVGRDTEALEGLPGDLVVVRTATLEPRRKLRPQAIETAEGEGVCLAGGVSRWQVWLGKALKFIETAVFIPDVQLLWVPIAVVRGWQAVRRYGVEVVFVSAPYFSLIITGCILKWLTGCKLVIDFRDDWADNPYYRSPFFWGRWWIRFLERRAVYMADALLLLTGRSMESFRRRYPEEVWSKYHFIPNGYDPQIEEILAEADATVGTEAHSPGGNGDSLKASELSYARAALWPGEFSLVHSGYLAWERNPEGLIYAVAELVKEDQELAERLRVYFLGNVAPRYQAKVEELGLGRWFVFCGQLPYAENIRRLSRTTVLLLIPSQNAPLSLPGKIFEYLYLGRPILALCGDNATRDFLEELQVGFLVDPHDVPGIKERLRELFALFREGRLASWPKVPGVERFSRKARAKELAQVLEGLVGRRQTG